MRKSQGVQPKSQPSGGIGRKGQYQRRQLVARMINGRVWSYHATKGWRSRKA
jgi:hypothetical protein